MLLHKYTAQEDIVVGTPYANRDMSVVQDVMGAFLNTLALRVDLSGDPSFRTAVQRARAVATQAFVHGNVPFAQVVDSLGLTRSAAFTPLYQVLEFAAKLGCGFSVAAIDMIHHRPSMHPILRQPVLTFILLLVMLRLC